MNNGDPMAPCVLAVEYGSDRKVAYMSITSPTGKMLTLRREVFSQMPSEFLRRVSVLLEPIAVPSDPEELERFRPSLHVVVPFSHLAAWKRLYEESLQP